MVKKLLLAAIVVMTCFLVACGSGSTNGSTELPSEETPENIVGPKTCYSGQKSNDGACVKLISINASKEGYLNPFSDPSFMKGANKEQYRRPVQAVDLIKTSPNLKIAANFVIKEFMSLQKGNFGIFSTSIVKKIQDLRKQTGAALEINSAYRSPKWNDTIDGSAKWSRHQYGDAVDIASSGVSLNKLVTLCKKLGATYVDKYVAHVHCDWRNTKLEPSFFGSVQSSQIQEMSADEERVNIVKELTETSGIQVSGELRAGNILLVSAVVQYKEDVEELYKRWIISSPNGDQLDLEQNEVSLPVQQAGTYQIRLQIGENIEHTKLIYVK